MLGLAALVPLPRSVLVAQRVATPVADARAEKEEVGVRVAVKVVAAVALPPSAPAGESEAVVLTMAREVGEGRLLGVGPRQAVRVAAAEALAAAESEATCSAVPLVEVEAVGDGLTLLDLLASEDWLAIACAVTEGSCVWALEAVATRVPAPLAVKLALAVTSAEALAVPAAVAVAAADAVEAALERASELRVGLSVLLAAPVAREARENVGAAEKVCSREAVAAADGRADEVGALTVTAGAEMLAQSVAAALPLAAAVSEGLADKRASEEVTAVGEGVGCAAVALAQFRVAVPTAPQLLLPAAVALPAPEADTHALAIWEEEGGAVWLLVALAVSLALAREGYGDCEALALAEPLAAEALEVCEAPRVSEVTAEAVAQALKDQAPELRTERVAVPLGWLVSVGASVAERVAVGNGEIVPAAEAEVDRLCRAVAVVLTRRGVPVAATLGEAELSAENDAAEGVESKETGMVPVACALADGQAVADKVGVNVAVALRSGDAVRRTVRVLLALALYEKAAIDAVGKAEAVPSHGVGEEPSLARGLSEALGDELPVALRAADLLTEADEVAVVVLQGEVLGAAEPLEERVASGETEAVVEGAALVLARGDPLKDGDLLPKAVLEGEGEEKRLTMPVGLPEGHPEAEEVVEGVLKAL